MKHHDNLTQFPADVTLQGWMCLSRTSGRIQKPPEEPSICSQRKEHGGVILATNQFIRLKRTLGGFQEEQLKLLPPE